MLENQKQIEVSTIEYFAKLLKAEATNLTRFNTNLIPYLISDMDNQALCAEPIMQEVKEAVYAIDKDSTVGLDEFSSLFYQQCWHIIAKDLLIAVKDFFSRSSFLKGVTSTTLVLLAKKLDAESWSDFHLISLCIVFNKIITKLLANRLAKILSSLILDNQSGFINGRLISDNILLAQELVSKINYKARGGNVILKLDMMKAYDRLNWDFLYLILEKFGFSCQWIDIIKRCISNCWFSLLVNGHLVGYFKSERGLRQNDSISLLLFILAAKYLSRGCSLNISHLAYADEIMIFTNGSKSALEKASGQKISQQQSCFITAPSIIAQSTGFHHKTLPVTYLGVLFHKGPKKTLLFDSLLSKIRDRISGWENKVLLPGGRITLIRSVLSSLPIYLLQVLKPPFPLGRFLGQQTETLDILE
ncbi:Reverse transcriptase domain - like 10 [Theobroma cacao]|nr:Reverse transcriptase domain - like 10 [Theobroma cacao]